MIGVLMVAAVFLVIGNSVRLSIFARRDTINVQKHRRHRRLYPASVPLRRSDAGLFRRVFIADPVGDSGNAPRRR